VNSNSPSSTAGSPAGGSYPTNSNGGSTSPTSTAGSGGSGSSGSSSHTNVGAIAGGVVGGIVGLIVLGLVILFFIRRRRVNQKKDPVDLLEPRDGDGRRSGDHPPEFYLPEPFRVPDPTVPAMSEISSAGGAENVADPERLHAGSRRQSALSLPTQGRLSSEGFSGTSATTSRKSPGGPATLRPVNIIQHDDAGPSEPQAEADEPETVELPPAYTNIRK